MARKEYTCAPPTSSFHAPIVGAACFAEPTLPPTHDIYSSSLPKPSRDRHVSGGSSRKGAGSGFSADTKRRHASGSAVRVRKKEVPSTRIQPAEEIIQTDAVIIGNGPSGITMSYMLSGHWPYYNGQPHSDEALTYRLNNQGTDTSLVEQDLTYLSDGLEGRSSNPVALLFDALTSPDADLGLELPSLLNWKYDPSKAVPHVVLGRRSEGGIWQTVDGQMQTLSLGTWMQLPDYPFKRCLDSSSQSDRPDTRPSQGPASNRVSMAEVQRYYSDYVTDKGLRPYFRNYTTVTSVHRLAPPTRPSTPASDAHPTFNFTNHETIRPQNINYITSQSSPFEFESTNQDESKKQSDTKPSEQQSDVISRKVLNSLFTSKDTPTAFQPTNHERLLAMSGRSLSSSYPIGTRMLDDETGLIDDESGEMLIHNKTSMSHTSLPATDNLDTLSPLWLVCGYETIMEDVEDVPNAHHHQVPRQRKRMVQFCYATKSVILATGAFDRPNRLGVPGESSATGTEEDSYVLHSFSDLEARCESDGVVLDSTSDPVLVVGAGLSAADAIISLLRAHVPVVHLFRRDPSARRGNAGFMAYRQLPANIYPEYAAVHQLMMGGKLEDVWEGIMGEGEEFDMIDTVIDRSSLYQACPASEVVEFTPDREVVIRSNDAMETVVKVSYAVVLIGSKPDLSFMPGNVLSRLGVVHGSRFIEPKHNPVDVDPWMYESRLFPGLYAMGPLVGDNFVRFLQGGALGITAHVWQRREESTPRPLMGVEDVVVEEETDCDSKTVSKVNSQTDVKACKIMSFLSNLIGQRSKGCCKTGFKLRAGLLKESPENIESGQGDAGLVAPIHA